MSISAARVVGLDRVETFKDPAQAVLVALEQLDESDVVALAGRVEQPPGLGPLLFMDPAERSVGEEARAAQARVRVRAGLHERQTAVSVGSACLALAIRSFIHAASSSGPSTGSAIRSPRMFTR